MTDIQPVQTDQVQKNTLPQEQPVQPQVPETTTLISKIRTAFDNLKAKIANCDKVRVLSASIALCAAVAAVATIFIANSFSISVVFFAVAVVASLVYVADCAKDSIKKVITSVIGWLHKKFDKNAEVKQNTTTNEVNNNIKATEEEEEEEEEEKEEIQKSEQNQNNVEEQISEEKTQKQAE